MSHIKRESEPPKKAATEPKPDPAEQPSAKNAEHPQNGEPASRPEAAQDTPNAESKVDQKVDPAAEIADLKERVLRTMADMDNLRKRTEREKTETAKYAITRFAQDILSVSDNIRRAIDAVPPEAIKAEEALKSLLEGVEMTEKGLLTAFEKHGITRVDPKGQLFDPNVHQAMFELENPDVTAGTIVEVVQAGYMISDRVLRPALVGISKGGAKLPKPASQETPQKAGAEAQPKPPEEAAVSAGKNPAKAAAGEPASPPRTQEKTARQPEPPQNPPAPDRPSKTQRPKPGTRFDRSA